jgi:hypothetical protein
VTVGVAGHEAAGAEVARRALDAMRRLVGGRAARGEADGGAWIRRLVERMEADPGDRDALEAASRASVAAMPEWRELGPGGRGWGARAERESRADEARAALGRLVLAGQLVEDGPERVALPGFGPATWRALAVLAKPSSGGSPSPAAARRWAAAVARRPLADLGTHAPPGLVADADPRLAPLADRLHALDAGRQDARHALLVGEARLAGAVDGGRAEGAALLRADCEAAAARIAALDALAARLWAEGEGAAGTAARAAR